MANINPKSLNAPTTVTRADLVDLLNEALVRGFQALKDAVAEEIRDNLVQEQGQQIPLATALEAVPDVARQGDE